MSQKTIQNTFKVELHRLILKLCHSLEMPLHFNHKGPKLFTEHQRLGLIVLFRRSKKSLRDFVRELPELKWVDWLGLKKIPSKSTIHSWDKQFSGKNIRLFNSIILREEMPSLMAIDATGIDSWQRSRHYQRRIGDPNMPFAKLDILIDTKTKLIHDHVLRVKPRHDTIGATSMFKRTKFRGIKILGDKGYDSENLHQEATNKGNLLFAPVRKSRRKQPKGTNRKRCKKGDEDYSQRNTVESVIHSLKSVRVHALKCKKHFMKKREIAWYILIHNMEKLTNISNLLTYLFKKQFWT